jgi:hypothetical protein
VSAVILRFPPRNPFSVRVEPEIGGDGWLVLAREHGWLHGSFDAALLEAHEIASGFGTVARSSAEGIAP